MAQGQTFHLLNEKVCTRLKLHGEDVRSLLVKNGWQETDRGHADVIFTNSCAFLQHVEDEAMDRVQGLEAEKRPEQKIVVFGCLPYINRPRLQQHFQGEIIQTRDVSAFVQRFNLTPHESRISYTITRKLNWISRLNQVLNALFFKDPYFYYLYEKGRICHLKISEGCLGTCTFCAEKDARGRLRSRRIDEIVREVERGLKEGYKIFSFNSDDTGVYGWDNKENIAQLLRKVLAIPADFRLVLTEFNPWGLIRFQEELVELLASPKVVFITVPLQSGSNRILRLMQRAYKIEDAKAVLRAVRRKNRSLKINTHMIAGFPGETEEDFRQSFNLIREFDFNKVKVFKYSDRKENASYNLLGKLDQKEIDRRYWTLKGFVLWRALRHFNLKEFLLNIGFYY